MRLDDVTAAAWAPALAPALAGLPADRRTWRVSRSGSHGLLVVSGAGLSWTEGGGLVTRGFLDVTGVEHLGPNGVVLHAAGLPPARLTFPDVRDRDEFDQTLAAFRGVGQEAVSPVQQYAPQPTAPQYAVPQPTAPQYAVPQPVAQYAPQPTAPQYAVPQPVAQYAVPQPVPQYATPQYAVAAPPVAAPVVAPYAAPVALPAEVPPVAPPVPAQNAGRSAGSVAQTRLVRALAADHEPPRHGHPGFAPPTYSRPAAAVPAAPVEAPRVEAPPTRNAGSHAPSTTRLRAARAAEQRRSGVAPAAAVEPEPLSTRAAREAASSAPRPAGGGSGPKGYDTVIGAIFLAVIGGLMVMISGQPPEGTAHSTGTDVLQLVGLALVAAGILGAVVGVARVVVTSSHAR